MRHKIRFKNRIRKALSAGSKRGSFAILATILFSSMMILAAAAVHAAGEDAIASTTDSFGPLWGRSILAEYDANLKDRYGIFAYSGNKLQVEEKIKKYVKYSFGSKKYVTVGACNCELSGYELVDSDNFFQQIKEAVAYDAKPTLDDGLLTAVQSVNSGGTDSESSSVSNRYIKNKAIINALPSGGDAKGIEISGLTEKVKEAKSLSDVIDDSAETVYIFRFFKDYVNDRDLGETYFNNEIEYIITGKLNDSRSKKAVKNYLTVLRNALNLVYLYSCDEKREATLAVAEVLMPEAPIITQALIMESWAFWEARNDVKMLYAGKTVPLVKKDENWATSLENMLAEEYSCDAEGNELVGTGSASSESGSSYILPQKVEGQDYEDYLKIFVAALPKETKKVRILDLIQINMKYLYCDYFLIDDYYTGLSYSIEINGGKHEFEERYSESN